ncbi:MAG TPA: hypothetical protein DET67_05070 [Ruegeria sp.]|nr:hypothetical protein [Ruegeria sp.]
MAILTCQQRHIFPFVSATPFDKAAQVGTRIGDDIVDLLNIVAFEANIFLPVPLAAMGQNSVAVRCRCGPRSSVNDIRPRFFWDRG